jgi:8-amino-7-oxononanoate synthase
MDNSAYDWIDGSLNTIHRANWYRQVKTITGKAGAVVEINGGKLVNFASNDYLGLATDERLINAAVEAVQTLGVGSTGSRLLSGHRELHRELERAIANLKQTEDALVFSSGYLANLGTIAAIVGKKDIIFSDRYNHSSLKNGAKLSGGKVIEYDHCNLEDLDAKIRKYRNQYRRSLIITDSVFSMDGDLSPLPQLIGLAKNSNSMLLIDEAHATGVMGKRGAGCVDHFGCDGENLVQIGTLSKALGSLGGYVAGKANLIDFLRNRAASWIYTTALSPADTAAALTAITIVEKESDRRQKLWHNVALLKEGLSHLKVLPSESAIICLELENPQQALTMAEKIQEGGFFVPAIRPPTVPTSRLRFSVMAIHQPKQIQDLSAILRGERNLAWDF